MVFSTVYLVLEKQPDKKEVANATSFYLPSKPS